MDRSAIVRWAVSGVFGVCCIGAAYTLGVTVTPVLGWLLAVLLSGVVTARVWYVNEERRSVQRDRDAAQANGAGARFDARGADEDEDWDGYGGTSMTVGPGRDAPHPVPDLPWAGRRAGTWSDPDED